MDLYSTRALLGILANLKQAPLFFLNTFFPTTSESESEVIDFDVLVGSRRIAPFVSPIVQGRIMESQGYTTQTFKPAYLKPKTPVEPGRALKRLAGEAIAGTLSPSEREAAIVAQILAEHLDSIRRRKEVMAVEALRLGQVTVAGDGYPTQVVDFQRPNGHTKALTTTARWGENDVSPIRNVEAWGSEMLQAGGGVLTDVVFEPVSAWSLFQADPLFKEAVDLRRAEPSAQDVNLGIMPDHVAYRGRMGNVNLWTYQDWYVNDGGSEVPLLPNHQVVLVSRPGLEGIQHHGAILDPAAGFVAVEAFPKAWLENDPARRVVMTQSAPLVVPRRPAASMGVTVR